MAFRKVHGVAEAHHLAQKIRPMAETLEDAGHLLTTGVGAPFVVDKGNFAVCVRVFNYIDVRLMIGHCPYLKVWHTAKRLAHFPPARAELDKPVRAPAAGLHLYG